MEPESDIFRSMESLGTLGSQRPTGIIITTTDPQLLTAKIINSLDYVISGLHHTSISKEFLERYFIKSTLTTNKNGDRQVMIWSPTSLAFGNEDDREAEGFGKTWDDTPAYINSKAFNHTSFSRERGQSAGVEYTPSIFTKSEQPLAPTEYSTPHSSPRNLSEEVGIAPSAEHLRTQFILDTLSLSEQEWPCSKDLATVSSTQSKGMGEGKVYRGSNVNGMGNDLYAAEALPTPSSVNPGTGPTFDWTDGEYSTEYPDLVNAIIKASSGVLDNWVEFEVVRALVGNNKTVKSLGFPSYTSMITEACKKKVLERKQVGNDSYLIRLLPPPSSLKPRDV